MNERIIVVEQDVSVLKNEKNKLLEIIKESEKDTEELLYLEREIVNYQNISNSYLKSCPQLAEQLINLRKELEKYTQADKKNEDLKKDKSNAIITSKSTTSTPAVNIYKRKHNSSNNLKKSSED